MNRIKNIASKALVVIILLYAVLLIPECSGDDINPAAGTQFFWDKDSLWNSLESSFVELKEQDCILLSEDIFRNYKLLSETLDTLEKSDPEPDSQIFQRIELLLFKTAPLAGVCPQYSENYFMLANRLRQLVKKKSILWNADDLLARNTLYKLLYGSRAAVEEVLLQLTDDSVPPPQITKDEPSSTPFTKFLGVKIHSGDILVSRGGAAVSALISRGNNYPGNFSHVALVYVDEETNIASILESHIERGVTISSLKDYIDDKKLRVMVLRPRSDLAALINNPMLPHNAAKASFERSKNEHIPYDFEMDFQDDSKLFCSEVASSVYKQQGIQLWMGKSRISSPGTVKLLSGFGVKYFETQEPSDLEYDPQLTVVAEWRDPETLYQDHIDNAVVDSIIEWLDSGGHIRYNHLMLPIVRVAKLYSLALNLLSKEGPVPEGMSPVSALIHESFTALHENIKSQVLIKASDFKNSYGYRPPYWRLLEFANQYQIK